jgi:hypothetical protein
MKPRPQKRGPMSLAVVSARIVTCCTNTDEDPRVPYEREVMWPSEEMILLQTLPYKG